MFQNKKRGILKSTLETSEQRERKELKENKFIKREMRVESLETLRLSPVRSKEDSSWPWAWGSENLILI